MTTKNLPPSACDWYIELDCAPGTPRPDTILISVLKGTALTPEDFIITEKLFGNWKFVPKKEKLEEYGKVRKLIGERVTQAYDTGRIRCGSW